MQPSIGYQGEGGGGVVFVIGRAKRALNLISSEISRDNWASEASPTLGCSIEISRDIYMYVCRYVCMSVVVQKA